MFKLNPLARAIAQATLITVAAATLVACGDDGSDGIDGTNGANGADGVNGIDGVAGTDGTDGADGADGVDGADGADGVDGSDGIDGTASNSSTGGNPQLKRIATVPLGAEVTGAFLTEEGDLFFNAQHPDIANTATDSADLVINKGTVGVLAGMNFNNLPSSIIEVPVPAVGSAEEQLVMAAYGTYQVLGQAGDTFGGTLPQGLGQVLASDGVTVVDDGSYLTETTTANMPDFNGYVSTGVGEGYLFTNWEWYPASMSRLAVSKDPVSGSWEVDNSDVMMLDFGAYGVVALCFGSVAPWGNPLTSEEWGNAGDSTHVWNDPNATGFVPANRDGLASYTDPTAPDATTASPFPNTYRYHYIVEITDPTGATPVPEKRYAMGRYEHENAIVMPDERTVYLSQDDTDGVFYKFIADVAGDLSSGTLYGAQLTQDAGVNDPAVTGFDITWIELASSDDTTIEGWIAEYDAIGVPDFVDGKSSYLTDADAIAWANGDVNYPSYTTASADAIAAGYTDANTFGGAVTADAVMDDRVAFLESRKAARAMGATAEWRKFEGIYVNQKRAEEAVDGTDLVPDEVVTDAYVYFAISDVDRGMIDGEGDIQLSDRVRDCGGVYRMRLEAGYDVARIEPAIMGATAQSTLGGDLECADDQLSQPDNVFVLDDGRVLIGEDGSAKNNNLWLFDPEA